jgi:hypothetical protein
VQRTDRFVQGVALMVAIAGSIILCIQGYRLLHIDAGSAAPFWRNPNIYVPVVERMPTLLRKRAAEQRWAAARRTCRDDGNRCAKAHKL